MTDLVPLSKYNSFLMHVLSFPFKEPEAPLQLGASGSNGAVYQHVIRTLFGSVVMPYAPSGVINVVKGSLHLPRKELYGLPDKQGIMNGVELRNLGDLDDLAIEVMKPYSIVYGGMAGAIYDIEGQQALGGVVLRKGDLSDMEAAYAATVLSAPSITSGSDHLDIFAAARNPLHALFMYSHIVASVHTEYDRKKSFFTPSISPCEAEPGRLLENMGSGDGTLAKIAVAYSHMMETLYLRGAKRTIFLNFPRE